MNIVFVAEYMFPYGSANAMRTRHIYKLLESLGHNVYVISDSEGTDADGQNEGYNYVSLYKTGRRLNYLVAPIRSVRKLKEYCDTQKVDLVVTNAEAARFDGIARFCKKRGIKLVVENCEWYDPSNFKFKKFDPRCFLYQKMMNKGFAKADGFISISRFLDEHNQKFGVSVRIPTILDVKSSPCGLSTNNEKLQIVYTGSPGKSKEFLRPICEALAEDEKLRANIVFNIYGPSYSGVVNNLGDENVLKKCGQSVQIHGRVPQNEIQQILMNADFLAFLRPQRRSSDAGFPTKLGESFAVGTPVIANETGDIGLYIQDGINGFLLKDTTVDAVRCVLHRALESKNTYLDMRKSARKTAEDHFDYRVYTEAAMCLLNGVFKDEGK